MYDSSDDTGNRRIPRFPASSKLCISVRINSGQMSPGQHPYRDPTITVVFQLSIARQNINRCLFRNYLSLFRAHLIIHCPHELLSACLAYPG